MAGVLIEHEQPTRRSLGERGLGDQVGGQVVGEVMALHARMVFQSPGRCWAGFGRRPPRSRRQVVVAPASL
jgi:hypothetical protein